jgi:hypothetical protein
LFFKEKYLPDGSFDRMKARLVAGGDQLDRELYGNSESPTASMSALFMCAGIAASERRKVESADVTAAYLNAQIPADQPPIMMTLGKDITQVYVNKHPEFKEFVRNNGSMTVKLEKALYGCIESARLWYDRLSDILMEFGYIRNPVERCVFNKGMGGEQVTVILYVDDLLITSQSAEGIEALKDHLRSRVGELKFRGGPKHSYLGMVFDFKDTGVKVTQPKFIDELTRHPLASGHALTPAADSLRDIDPSAKLLDISQTKDFHSTIAKCLYLAKRTRPDLLTVVSFLTTRVMAPTVQDWRKLGRLLRYINSTRELGVKLSAQQPIEITASIDASYGVHADGKSHSGICISIGKGAVFAKSTRQKIVTKSSAEAELVALSDGASQVIWSRDFLINQGYTCAPAVIEQDNMSTIASMKKGYHASERSRHIAIKYFWLHDRMKGNEIDLKYTVTDDMIADMLTKPLQGERFERLRGLLLNWNM